MKLKIIVSLVFCVGIVYHLHGQIFPAAFGVSTPSRPGVSNFGSSGPIITSGLVLFLDAGNTASYPGTGTTWTDLSGAGNNGTLTNGPTYTSSNGGAIVFDGINDFVNSGSSISLPGNISVFAWVYATSFNTDWNLIVTKWFTATGEAQDFHWALKSSTSGANPKQNLYTTSNSDIYGNSTFSLNTWYNIGFTLVKGGTLTFYKNGVADGTSNSVSRTSQISNLQIGENRAYVAAGLKGRIPQVSIYNRALTAAEVLENYNALRPRFDYVTIGSQVWTSKNLDVTTYRNGDPIPQVTNPSEWAGLTTGAWCYFNNDPANGAIYGKLYNWYAVNDSRGLAPAGWHIPTDAEWTTLGASLGGDNVAGGKMKMTGTSYWSSPNTGATNSSGFSGLPGGYGGESFGSFGNYGSFWTATESGVSTAWTRDLGYNYDYLYRFSLHNKRAGFSVRCIKD